MVLVWYPAQTHGIEADLRNAPGFFSFSFPRSAWECRLRLMGRSLRSIHTTQGECMHSLAERGNESRERMAWCMALVQGAEAL